MRFLRGAATRNDAHRRFLRAIAAAARPRRPQARSLCASVRATRQQLLCAGRFGPLELGPALRTVPPSVLRAESLAVDALSASVSHALLAGRRGSDVVLGAIGRNGAGQLGSGAAEDSAQHAILLDAAALPRGAHMLATGNGFSWVADAMQVFAFGTNVRGQLGLGDDAPEMCASPTPVPLPLGHTLCDLAAGLDHVLLLTSDGRQQAVFSCGLDTDGQLGNDTRRFSSVLRPVQVQGVAPGDSFVRVAAGGDTSYLLSARGRLWMWGNAEYGQALQPPGASVGDQVTPPVEAVLDAAEARIVDVRVGGSFVVMLDDRRMATLAPHLLRCAHAALVATATHERAAPSELKRGGVYTAGYGALGLGEQRSAPLTRVPLPPVHMVGAGLDYAVAAAGEELFYWGIAGARLPHSGDGRIGTPQRTQCAGRIQALACGGDALLVLTEDGVAPQGIWK